ncbi:MAG TPA: methyltransferase domain-containing protein [Verrucomicrobiae bacterium]|nr:methyltransferase domain-containing protein [Verrucomicrobiae bacterium]
MSHNYWEQLYQNGDMHWDKGAPSPGLVDFLAARPELGGGNAPLATTATATTVSRPRPSVCVPGCGTGHDVREFARAGFDAWGVDIAPSAVRLGEERTKAAGLEAVFRRADFLHSDPPQLFDWIFEHTLFCAIKPEERDDYVRAVLRWLKPDGQYLAVNYMIIEDGEGPPFPTTRDELLRRFSPHLELAADWMPRSYPNRAGREWMFWWRQKVR